MQKTSDINVLETRRLPSPAQLLGELPKSEAQQPGGDQAPTPGPTRVVRLAHLHPAFAAVIGSALPAALTMVNVPAVGSIAWIFP